MINNLDLSLEGIARAGLTCVKEVRGTITALGAAGQVVVIIKSRQRPILLSLNQHRKKMYLIDQMLRPNDHPLRWGLQLPEISECTKQPLFSDPYQKNVALAQLVMGASLNVQGLMLELPIPADHLSNANCLKIVDENGVSHGSIEILSASKIIMDLPIVSQAKALEVFKELWLISRPGTMYFRSLCIYNAQHEELLRT
ncbi:hypothetical protein [Deinococcus sp. UYEF24]